MGYIGFHADGYAGRKVVRKRGRIGSELPERYRINLALTTDKPLILKTGARIKGMVVLRKKPRFEGGEIDGELQIKRFRLPAVRVRLIDQEIERLTTLLSSPADFDTEYFTSLILEGGANIPSRTYINGSLNMDHWEGMARTIATTGVVTIEWSRLERCLILSSAPITISNSKLNRCMIFTPSLGVEGETTISGTIITTELVMTGGTLTDITIYLRGREIRALLDGGRITGCLFALERGRLGIGPNFIYQGLIHSLATVSVEGKIEGYLFAHQLKDNSLEGSILPPPFRILIPMIYGELGRVKLLSFNLDASGLPGNLKSRLSIASLAFLRLPLLTRCSIFRSRTLGRSGESGNSRSNLLIVTTSQPSA